MPLTIYEYNHIMAKLQKMISGGRKDLGMQWVEIGDIERVLLAITEPEIINQPGRFEVSIDKAQE